MIMRIYTSTTLGLLLLISLGAHAGSARAQSPEEYLTEYGQALVDAYAPLDTAISDSSATVSTIQVERHRLVTLSGFGADVLDVEPPPDGHPLLSIPNVVITPHSAGLTRTTYRDSCVRSVRNVLAVLEGHQPEPGCVFNAGELVGA